MRIPKEHQWTEEKLIARLDDPAMDEVLRELLDGDYMSDVQAGVVRQLLASGYGSLSPRQRRVVRIVQVAFLNLACTRCGDPIETNELPFAWENGEYSLYCQHVHVKEDIPLVGLDGVDR